MERSGFHAVLWAIAVFGAAAPGLADEIDDLADRINLPQRFHGYKPKFHYAQKTFSFEHPGGPKQQILRLIMDGQRYVAIIADEAVDPEKVEAEYANGVLTIHLKKSPSALAKRINVKTRDEPREPERQDQA